MGPGLSWGAEEGPGCGSGKAGSASDEWRDLQSPALSEPQFSRVEMGWVAWGSRGDHTYDSLEHSGFSFSVSSLCTQGLQRCLELIPAYLFNDSLRGTLQHALATHTS